MRKCWNCGKPTSDENSRVCSDKICQRAEKRSQRGDFKSRSVVRYNEKVREYTREYYQRPEVKERQREYSREYNQRPEVKERKRKYKQRPEVKEQRREYNQRPEVRERKRKYQREYQRKYYRRQKKLREEE